MAAAWTDAQVQAYDRLMAQAAQPKHPDAHAFACVLARAAADGVDPCRFTGLSADHLAALLAAWFPGAALPRLSEPGEDELEEADLRALLLAGRAAETPEEVWWSAIVARRSLNPDHLWHSIGLRERPELSALLMRHFPGLASRNTRNMRWKKFFYRTMCEAEDVLICKSPICDTCPDIRECFAPDSEL